MGWDREGKSSHLVKWALVTQSLKLGGLGIGNVRVYRPQESDSSWHKVKVIVSKYSLCPFEWI